MANGEDAREALASVASLTWDELEAQWRRALRERPARPSAPSLLARRFRTGDADETHEVVEAARRALRLGDLLWARRRFRAAELEYRQALTAAPGDPIISARLARAALAAGNPAGAIEALTEVRTRYPEHAPVWATLSAAYLAAGDEPAARHAAQVAIRLNPFDPEPHCVLAQTAQRESQRRLEEDQCEARDVTP